MSGITCSFLLNNINHTFLINIYLNLKGVKRNQSDSKTLQKAMGNQISELELTNLKCWEMLGWFKSVPLVPSSGDGDFVI